MTIKRIVLVAGLALSAHLASACDKGCYPYKDTCACDFKPETAPSVKPDNVEAPQSHQNPWEREGVHIYNAPDLRDQDRKQDEEIKAADQEGKRKAGIYGNQ